MSYTKFNQSESVKSLDLNTIDPCKISIFPYNIYSGDLMPAEMTPCPVGNYNNSYPTPRNTHSQYIYGAERFDHPKDLFTTRFYRASGYPNEYGLGSKSRGYTPRFSTCGATEPKGVAPEKFYQCNDTKGCVSDPKHFTDCQPKCCGYSKDSEAYQQDLEEKLLFQYPMF